MANDKFFPRYSDFRGHLDHLVEECGEVVAAAGKAMRFGTLGVNPHLPESEQETNLDWLKREMADLKGAIARMEQAIQFHYPS